MNLTAEERKQAIAETRRARLEGQPVPSKYRSMGERDVRAAKKVHQIKGGASKARPGNARPTQNQIDFVRVLEEGTNTPERDLGDMTRIEVSDYITVLKHRQAKAGVR